MNQLFLNLTKKDGSIDVEISVTDSSFKPVVDLGDYKSLVPAVEAKRMVFDIKKLISKD